MPIVFRDDFSDITEIGWASVPREPQINLIDPYRSSWLDLYSNAGGRTYGQTSLFQTAYGMWDDPSGVTRPTAEQPVTAEVVVKWADVLAGYNRPPIQLRMVSGDDRGSADKSYLISLQTRPATDGFRVFLSTPSVFEVMDYHPWLAPVFAAEATGNLADFGGVTYDAPFYAAKPGQETVRLKLVAGPDTAKIYVDGDLLAEVNGPIPWAYSAWPDPTFGNIYAVEVDALEVTVWEGDTGPVIAPEFWTNFSNCYEVP